MRPPYCKPWLILFENGNIASAHCKCMAGLGEVCRHTGALAFAIYSLNIGELSCTDKLCKWSVPTKKVGPKRMKDIDLGKPLKSYPSKFI